MLVSSFLYSRKRFFRRVKTGSEFLVLFTTLSFVSFFFVYFAVAFDREAEESDREKPVP